MRFLKIQSLDYTYCFAGILTISIIAGYTGYTIINQTQLLHRRVEIITIIFIMASILYIIDFINTIFICRSPKSFRNLHEFVSLADLVREKAKEFEESFRKE